MKKLILFCKSIKYSFKLIYESSGLKIVIYFFLNILGSMINIFNMFVIKHTIDQLLNRRFGVENIFWGGFIYILLLVVAQINTSLQGILYDEIFKKAEHQYDCDIVKKVIDLPLAIIDSSTGKDMIDDLSYIKNTVVYGTYQLIRIVSLFSSFIIAFLTILDYNLIFTLLFFITAIPGGILSENIEKRAETFRREKAPDVRKFSYYRWMLTDAWPAKDVRMYNLTDPIKFRYNEEKNKYIAANLKMAKIKLNALLISEIIFRSGQIAFVFFVIFEAIDNNISIGDVTLYIGLSNSFSHSFQTMLHIFISECNRTTEKIQRLFDFFYIKGEENICSRKFDEFKSLTFDNVYFKYPNSKDYILSGVSFTLSKGDKMSIIGINGSGKSTIIKLMLGLYKAESGNILINDHPMSDYGINDVRNLFTVLFQNFVKYPLTLRENIALSNIQDIKNDKKIEVALQKSGLFDDIYKKLKYGNDSYMTRTFDDDGVELSKGQWQKLALSRAYFKESPIVILDEPSAALDAEAEERIFRDFSSITTNKTGIMISHRISSARMTNKIIVLDKGKIIEQGTHDELIKNDGLYKELYTLQYNKYVV